MNGPYSADDTRLDFRVDGAWLAPKIYAGTRGKVYRFGRAFERAGGELRERSLVFRKLVRNIEVSRVLTAKERRKDAPKLPRSQEPGSIAVTLRHGTYTYADYVYVPPITVLGERKVHTSHKKVGAGIWWALTAGSRHLCWVRPRLTILADVQSRSLWTGVQR